MATSDAPSLATIQLAEESFRRCASEAFFLAFYRRMLADEATRQKFEHTDFERQVKLIQHGLGLLFSFAKRKNPALLERIAVRHGKQDLDIRPDEYPHFIESMLGAIREFDPQCSAEVEEAWRQSLTPGILFMTTRYDPQALEGGG